MVKFPDAKLADEARDAIDEMELDEKRLQQKVKDYPKNKDEKGDTEIERDKIQGLR